MAFGITPVHIVADYETINTMIMFVQISVLLFSMLSTMLTEMVVPGIDRTIPDGVKSTGYNYQVVYGGQDLTVVNEVVKEVERSSNLPVDKNAFHSMPPLPPTDVKCLMSADRYCSDDMKQMKAILIQAIREDCKKCSDEQKEKAGRTVAAMLIHDPSAWKIFLTRLAVQMTPTEIRKFEEFDYRVVGEPEEIQNSRNRHILKGCKVKIRVRKYKMDIFPKK